MPAYNVQSRLLSTSLVFLLAILLSPRDGLYGQGSIQVGSRRPFVTGLQPVVGPGVVGGVKVDAKGIVRLATAADVQSIKRAREVALRELRTETARTSKSRKVSLRRLDEALRARRKAGKPVTDAMRHLAGMQRIRFVFVYPAVNDIVLVGSAEGWKVNERGEVVGAKSDRPPLQLDDLIVALRNARATKIATLSCSIDPTRRGVIQLRRLLARKGLRVNRLTLAAMERAMGPQKVTFEGISPSTYFAHVMLAADVRMKRLAMGLEKSPVSGLPSYLDLLRSAGGSPPKNAMPRWWLAPEYEPLRKGARNLAWELRGRGVKVMTEKNSHPLVKKWAASMTASYPKLGRSIPVFAKLQNCMDLAIVSALITDYQLMKVAGVKLEFLTNQKLLQAAEFPTPSNLAAHASAIRKGRNWIISLSGGVQMNPWKAIEKSGEWKRTDAYMATTPKKSAKRWWWD